MSDRDQAVVVDGVSKAFSLPKERVHTLKERALHPLRRRDMDSFPALTDVSFDVKRGEFFGIVGRNGSGKSTLLKCMAGIYKADTGQVLVAGRVSTFIELGVGFNPDLAARDNAILNAIMLGLTRREALERYDRIIDFAGLREFEELKLKNYSSGMLVRLAFSVMIQVDADVLLIDEVLAVGDVAFQQKCYDEFARIRRSGATVCLVTHDMSAVQRFCDRAVLLEHGRVVEIADPERVANRYVELNFDKKARAEQAGEPHEEQAAPDLAHDRGSRLSDQRASITGAWFEDHEGRRTEVLVSGQPCTFVLTAHFNEDVEDPLFGLDLNTVDDSRPTVAVSSLWTDPRLGLYAAGSDVTVRFRLENPLAPDRYEVSAAIACQGAYIDRYNRFYSVMVTGARASGAYVEPNYTIEVERRHTQPDQPGTVVGG